MPPDPAEVRRWVEKAEHDRLVVELLLGRTPVLTDVCAFHCQQAVEKYLKAFLVARNVEFEKTHDLRLLISSCCDQDPSLNSVRQQVAALTAFAVRFRYPGSPDPSVEQIRDALSVVEQVKDIVTTVLRSTSAL